MATRRAVLGAAALLPGLAVIDDKHEDGHTAVTLTDNGATVTR